MTVSSLLRNRLYSFLKHFEGLFQKFIEKMNFGLLNATGTPKYQIYWILMMIAVIWIPKYHWHYTIPVIWERFEKLSILLNSRKHFGTGMLPGNGCRMLREEHKITIVTKYLSRLTTHSPSGLWRSESFFRSLPIFSSFPVSFFIRSAIAWLASTRTKIKKHFACSITSKLSDLATVNNYCLEVRIDSTVY